MAKPTILVVGATGKQGGAVVRALLQHSPAPRILALTRNAESPKAQALVAAHHANGGSVELAQGDATSPEPIFAAYAKGSIDAVFVVTTPPKEEQQAIPLMDAAVAHGVGHVVFSSVDRGGEPRSWANPTRVTHFLEKHNVETHLRDACADRETTWTILRPVAFMDNFNPGFFGSMFPSMWGIALSPTTKLQLVSSRDIGVWAARALLDPHAYAGRAISLAGDEVTLDEAGAIFARATGQPLPRAWWILGKFLLWAIGDVGRMFAFFEAEGYGADIAALREEDQDLLGLERWLREESGWKDRKED